MATKEQQKAFIDLIAPAVVASCEKHKWGVPSAIIAQAGIESAWGTSGLWKTCFNGWGMKFKEGCGTAYKEYRTKEQTKDGIYYEIVARFRKYPDVQSGIDGYFKFIESYSRYKPVMAVSHSDYKEYAKQIKNCGWATSINYTQNIIATVEKNNLQIYDKGKTVQYYPEYDGSAVQIDEILHRIGVPDEYVGSWEKRKPIAYANGILNYTGTGKQNTIICDLARRGQLRKV